MFDFYFNCHFLFRKLLAFHGPLSIDKSYLTSLHSDVHFDGRYHLLHLLYRKPLPTEIVHRLPENLANGHFHRKANGIDFFVLHVSASGYGHGVLFHVFLDLHELVRNIHVDIGHLHVRMIFIEPLVDVPLSITSGFHRGVCLHHIPIVLNNVWSGSNNLMVPLLPCQDSPLHKDKSIPKLLQEYPHNWAYAIDQFPVEKYQAMFLSKRSYTGGKAKSKSRQQKK